MSGGVRDRFCPDRRRGSHGHTRTCTPLGPVRTYRSNLESGSERKSPKEGDGRWLPQPLCCARAARRASG
eukprot:6197293-Pleurochrysis_carterae.AAC.2